MGLVISPNLQTRAYGACERPPVSPDFRVPPPPPNTWLRHCVLQYACYYLHHNLWSEVTLNVLLLHLSVFGTAVQMPISLVVCLSQFVSFIYTPYLIKMLHRIPGNSDHSGLSVSVHFSLKACISIHKLLWVIVILTFKFITSWWVITLYTAVNCNVCRQRDVD